MMPIIKLIICLFNKNVFSTKIQDNNVESTSHIQVHLKY